MERPSISTLFVLSTNVRLGYFRVTGSRIPPRFFESERPAPRHLIKEPRGLEDASRVSQDEKLVHAQATLLNSRVKSTRCL